MEDYLRYTAELSPQGSNSYPREPLERTGTHAETDYTQDYSL